MRFGFATSVLAALAVASCGTHEVLFSDGTGGTQPSSSSSTTSGTGGGTTSTSGTGGSTSTSGTGGSTSTSGTGGSTSTSGTGGAGGMGGVGGEGGETCTDAYVPVEPAHLPVDAIVAVPNTSTMSGTQAGVEQHLYGSFVAVLEGQGVDVQVIVVSAHGTSWADVCIPPPLSSSNNCNGAPGNVPGKFQHYSTMLTWGSTLCKLLDTLYGNTPDEFSLAPNGWSSWLRPAAFKAFLAMDTYQTSCAYNGQTWQDLSQSAAGQQVALAWDSALLGLAPAHFGTPADRRYVFHSLVGMTPKPNNQPYEPFENVLVTSCTSYQPGTAFQWLSKGTEGWRYSLCGSPSFPAMFAGLATRIADRTEEACAFQSPDPPPGFEPLNLSLLSMLYTPSNGPLQPLAPVPSLGACSGNGFYWDGDVARLCPTTCSAVTGDPNGQLEFRFHCPSP